MAKCKLCGKEGLHEIINGDGKFVLREITFMGELPHSNFCHIAKKKPLYFLRSELFGSVLHFYSVLEDHGAWVLLNNGERVAFRDGKYFYQIPNWERVSYERFETKDDCINFIKKNYNEYKEWDCNQEFTKDQFIENIGKIE